MTLVLCLPFLVELDFGNVGFIWGEGKTEVPGEKPIGAKERTSNKLNPHTTYGTDAGIWTRATLVEGECSHHCATLAPAPLTTIKPQYWTYMYSALRIQYNFYILQSYG